MTRPQPDPPSAPPRRASPSGGMIDRRGILRAAAALALPAAPLAAAGTGRGADGLRVGGTGAALGITQLLLEMHVASDEVPGPEPLVLPSLGTSGGLAALRGGRLDLALTARPLLPAEQAQGLTALAFGRTPICIATRADTLAQAVTLDEVGRILAGEMMNWPGGGLIRLVRRDRSESDWLILGAASPQIARAIERVHARPGLATAVTDQENAELLEQVAGSFGLISLGQLMSERRRLRTLALDGVEPTPATIADGRYPFIRTVFAVTRADAAPAVRAFIDFLATPYAHRLLERFGYQPQAGIPV